MQGKLPMHLSPRIERDSVFEDVLGTSHEMIGHHGHREP